MFYVSLNLFSKILLNPGKNGTKGNTLIEEIPNVVLAEWCHISSHLSPYSLSHIPRMFPIALSGFCYRFVSIDSLFVVGQNPYRSYLPYTPAMISAAVSNEFPQIDNNLLKYVSLAPYSRAIRCCDSAWLDLQLKINIKICCFSQLHRRVFHVKYRRFNW